MPQCEPKPELKRIMTEPELEGQVASPQSRSIENNPQTREGWGGLVARWNIRPLRTARQSDSDAQRRELHLAAFKVESGLTPSAECAGESTI